MALPGNRDDREFEKFTEVSSEPAVRVDVVRTVGGGGSTATEYTDDSSFTIASDKGNAVGGIFTTDTIDSGDFGVFKINANRELSVVVENASSIGGGDQYTDATAVAGGQKGTVAMGTDGSNLQFLSVDSTGALKVNSITNAVAVTQSGTWNIGTVTTLTGITNDVSIDDGGNSITVDDGGSSLTIDGTVSSTQSGTWNVGVTEIDTDDLDTGAGTDTQAIFGVALPDVGGHTLWDTSIKLQDGSGTTISSTSNALDVNVASGTLTANIEGDYTDDSAFTVATDKGLAVGGINTSDTIDAGDFGVFKLNASRELATTVENTVDTNITNSTLAVTQSGTWNVGLSTGSNTIGKVKLTDGTNDLSITAGGLMPISDNGGSITVDGTVSITEIETDDLDTGAGTDTQAIMGIAIPGSGGHSLWDESIKLQDGSGTSISSTVVGADTGIDVNVLNDLTVDLSEANDSVLVYGNDGTTNRAIKTDTSGNLQVDIVASLPTGTNSIGDIANITNVVSVDDNGGSLTVDGTVAATQSGTWNIGTLTSITNDVSIDDGGNSITVDDGGSSLTVDGTVTANQGGSWSVTVLNDGRTRSKYTEVSAGIPPNSIVWNSTTSGPILNKFRILGITCHFAGAPVANDFIVQLNDAADPLLNVIFWKVDPGTLGLTDISWHPTGEIIIDPTSTESLDIMWTNGAPQVDWGLRVIIEELV